MTPEQFVAHWAGTQLKETASYVTHFDDLCELLGHPKPAHVDKTGEFFTYQKGVIKDDSGEVIRHGFADVWYRGHFAWEYKGKGKHKDLDAAFRQLLLYKNSLENPRLLVVSDIERYEIHTNFSDTVSRVYAFTNADLARNVPVPGSRFTPVQILDKLFRDPDALRPEQTVERATDDAARQFARLADSMHKHRVPPFHAARFLVKLVFCLFCEDVGLLPKDLFTRIVAATKDRPAEFVRHMRELFGAMASGGRLMWGESILHFDGGLFSAAENDPDVIEFDGADLRELEDAARLDWADIDPSIFGTLFERALDVEGKRAQLGAHYTSRADIETLVEPVLMAPLRREWQAVQAHTADHLDWRSERRKGPREKKRAALEALLRGFQDRLACLRVLDPACGSGNFLYVSLSMLKDLEKEVITFGLNVGIPDLGPRVGPAQLHGIEKDDYAFQLASIVVWIGYLQWKAKNGYPPAGETPILKPLDTIRQMDAIFSLAPSPPEEGDQGPTGAAEPAAPEVCEPSWPAVDVIVGNPPFLGGKKLRAELGDGYVDAIFELYEGRVPHEADLVCYWFEKARAMVEAGKVKRAGLLATQAIRGGANRGVLKRIKSSGDIFWAQSDREWIQDGVAVHVSMLGFDDGTDQSRWLDDRPVSVINPDLTAAADLTRARRLGENLNIAYMGDTKGGPFDIPDDLARDMLVRPNPLGRNNSDVVRPWVNGLDVTRRPRGMWIIDFGTMALDEAALYEAPFEYVRKHVKPEREKNNRQAYRERWWLHVEPRPSMRMNLSRLGRYVATTTVSKFRLFVWLDSAVLPDHQLIVFARDDDYFFGVLHSKIHELWARGTGTQLREAESGFRYTPTSTFETFPFPWPPGQEPKDDPYVRSIAEAARELDEKRESWLNPYKDEPSAIRVDLKKRTLTNLYNDMPTWLRLAHDKLDRAVLDAYGWPHDLSDDDILSRLLAENLKREAAGRGEG